MKAVVADYEPSDGTFSSTNVPDIASLAPGAGEDDGCVDTVVLMSPALCSPSRGECRVQL